MSDPDEQNKPFVAPYVLNESSVVLNGQDGWPMSSQQPAPAPPRRHWVAPVVILSVVALVGGLIAIGGVEFQAVSQHGLSPGSGDNPDIGVPDAPPGSDGIPSPAASAVVTVCPSHCFTVASAGLMVPNGSLQGSMPIGGLAVSPDFQHPTTAAVEYQADASAWSAGTPRAGPCFFTDSRSPISPLLGGSDSTASDPVAFLGESEDEVRGSTMTQSARFFASTDAATDYVNRLRAQILACHLVDPAVDSAANFDLPPGITAVTFAETSSSAVTYVYDFQRANTVVRFRVVSSDHVDENAVRHFLGTWVTTDLAQLDAD